MLLFLEYLPLALFFLFYLMGDIFLATGVLMLGTVLQITALKFMKEIITPRHWIILWVVLVFGTITLLLHDEWFIKLKVSVIYVAIAAFLLGGLWWKKRSPLQAFLGEEINLPDFAWRRLTYVWVGFAIAVALVNLYIAQYWSLDAWVNFKVFGIIGATLVLSIFTGGYMFKHHTDRDKDAEEIE